MPRGLTRRDVVRAGAAAGALAGLDAIAPAQVLDRVLAAPGAIPGCSSLSEIEHVVIFINENRSFDHYFGTYRGVRGFSDPTALRLSGGQPVFAQPFGPGQNLPAPDPPAAAYGGHLLPFHFDTNNQGECVNDITHEWPAQHQAWNGGAMDSFLKVHLAASPNNGANTMGYYTRGDLPFYHALADAFTLCDGYFCSVIGPTDPNRLYSMSAWLGQDGVHGGPILTTSSTRRERFGTLTWRTYPEQLQAAGISWKVYATPDGNYGDNVLPYFAAYQQDPQLAANALGPSFPAQFMADCAAGTLPQVSWVLGSLVDSEHPPAPVTSGEAVTAQILNAMTANPALWAKSALFITYDENGGFFDHLPPPAPPAGTAGEYLTVSPLPSAAGGVNGPIGLGFRVPLLVVSPFSRGGFVCSDVFDHTSLLRFLERRFGPEVPNLSTWRRAATGDLTSAFNFLHVNASVPTLPQPSRTDSRVLTSDCPTQAPDTGSESFPTVKPYPPPPPPQSLPLQEAGVAQRPSGLCAAVDLNGRGVNGVGLAGNPLGLPSTTGCVDTRRFAFHVHRPHGRRVVRVAVYVNGRHIKTVRARHGHSINRLVLQSVPEGLFTLKIVAHTANHHRVVTVRQYHGCTKGPPHTLHGRRRGQSA